MNSETFYHRLRIDGTLTVVTALHVGSGIVSEFSAQENISYNQLCRDGQDRPYVPASTLRGHLADLGRGQEELFHRVFGQGTSERTRAGALRVYDALVSSLGPPPPQHLPQGTALRTSVALNPITGVAEAHQLFTLEYVPVGSVLTCHFELEEVEESVLFYFLNLLAAWDGTVRSSLGSGASKGRGRVRWTLEKVEGLDREGLRQWLLLDQDHSLASFYRVLPKPATGFLPPSEGLRLLFRLYPQGPFLLHDPAFVQDSAEENNVPHLEYSRTAENHALIPATALRGWMRGRARRILLTLGVEKGHSWEKASAKAEELLESLFGSTRSQSLLWFDDAVSPEVAQPHLQMFNGVDRFTGGVAEGKLYQVRAADCEYLEGAVYGPTDFLERDQGLLLLLLRDILEGELVLGWGKGRGYGRFHVGLHIGAEQEITEWAELKASLHPHIPSFQDRLKALHESLE